MTRAVAPDGGPAGAVAVAGGRIAALGRDAASLRELTGPGTEVVSLRGRALLPGFQDAHVHPAFAGVAMVGCSLIGAPTLAQALDRIGAYAAAHPEKEWISGSGWRLEWFAGGTPGRAALDAVVGDRPAFLLNRDGHGAWASSAALRLAGLDRHTPDPPDGRIEREDDGTPQGTLHEGAASLVGLVPELSLEEQVTGLLLAQQHLHQRGITAWQDAIVGSYLGSADPLPAYLAAASSGRLTARVRGALWWDRTRGAEQLDELRSRRELGQAGRFSAGTVKIMQDGVAENFTAGMIDPYLDPAHCHDHGSGLSYVDPGALREYVTRLDAEHFQVHLHAIGDRAVREALDAIAAARTANGPGGASANRHHIAHLQVVHPDDVRRFARLGVTANVQALWAAHEPQMDELTIPFLGPERTARQYLFRDLLASGARLAAGSDWAVSSASPMRAVHVAVNRSLQGYDTEPFLPEQRLDLAEALAAYTFGSAYVNHLDGQTGTIEPGQLADLVVLGRDPFEHPSADIASTPVAATYVQGEAVYRAGVGSSGMVFQASRAEAGGWQ